MEYHLISPAKLKYDLIHCKRCIGADNIEKVTLAAPVTYAHILFDAHWVIFANGASAESLNTGPQALQELSDEARNGIHEIFPELEVAGKVAQLARATVQKKSTGEQAAGKASKKPEGVGDSEDLRQLGMN